MTSPASKLPEGARASDAVVRLLDLLISGGALVLLSPILLAIMMILRFSGEGEIFYRQVRVGHHRRRFSLLKFATMLKDSPNIASGELTLPADPRVLPVGKFLRRTKLNELPQLVNILRGELSLVGPRPQTPHYFNAFPPDTQACVASVRPGLTGIGSIIFRNEEDIFARVADPVAFDHQVIVPYKGSLECWFVAHRSLSLYLEVIATTAVVVLFPTLSQHRRLRARLPRPPADLAPLL